MKSQLIDPHHVCDSCMKSSVDFYCALSSLWIGEQITTVGLNEWHNSGDVAPIPSTASQTEINVYSIWGFKAMILNLAQYFWSVKYLLIYCLFSVPDLFRKSREDSEKRDYLYYMVIAYTKLKVCHSFSFLLYLSILQEITILSIHASYRQIQ